MGKDALKTVNIDLPEWIIADLDAEAEQLGINRKALINVLLASVLRAKRNQGQYFLDTGYLGAIERSFAKEWGSKEDDEAFKDL
jgi:hypothetical protein